MAAATTSTPSNSSVLSSLSDAIENEDIQTLKSLLSNNPEILDLAAKNWPKNPLILAWKLRKFLVIAEIGIWKPEFAAEKMQEGFTILHLACIRGDVEMVRALVRLDSQLCLLKDDCHCMTPLQLAVKHGHGDVIREILLSCPESIEKLTSQKETVFHLAANKHQSDAFEVLLDEAMKLNQQHLLCQRDRHGNTALHIAVSNQLIRVVKLLLPEPNWGTGGRGFRIQVNAKNKKGETALDLYYQIPDRGLATHEIGHLLREAGGCEGNLWEQKQSFPNMKSATNDLLVVLAIFIGLAFTITCSLPTFFPKEHFVASREVFQYKDVATHDLPLVLYIMSIITVVFATSMGFLLVLMCSFPCGNLLHLTGIATSMAYMLYTSYIVPKFSIRIVTHHYISSFYLMWILAVGLFFCIFFCIALTNLVWKCLPMIIYDFAKWLKMKLDSNVPTPSKKKLQYLKQLSGVQMDGIASTTTAAAASNN
ncbi:hypothetical protein Dsin_011606 [Dipteronia sinensis]|uniref:PGG domain-containing protein n=1 Tax=Dipteronia sinensis TaxID=43782 RepID=A0AAE0AGQ4_9ROSI|nr:hypothetical protein Dsin_011606 [Dipteronia sinensis]